MASAMATKARSQRGASLSMALMLLLVCTTVASIVIAAGTASVGRLSQLKMSDRSYYNVTSAAKLLWDTFKDPTSNTVTITRSCTANEIEDDWEIVEGSWEYSLDGTDGTGAEFSKTNATLCEVISLDIIFGTSGELDERRIITDSNIASSMDLSLAVPEPKDPNYNPSLSYEFSVRPADGTSDSLEQSFPQVNVSVTCDKMGFYYFTLSEEDNPSSYRCTLMALADVQAIGSSPNRTPLGFSGEVSLEWASQITWTPCSLSAGA